MQLCIWGWLTVALALQSSVTRRTGQIQDDQLGVVRFVDNHLIQFDGGVHTPNVALVAVMCLHWGGWFGFGI